MPQPIINDILPLTQIVAGNNQTVYSTNWTANAAADVVVYNTPSGQAADDVADFVNPSQYTVAFIGNLQTVQVTFLSAPTQNNIITITRTTPVSRQNLYTNTNFTPSMLNQDFALFILEIQENDLVNQQVAPRYNYSAVVTPVVDTILPLLGANQVWAKNSNNTAFIPYTIPSQGIAPADAKYVLLAADSLLPNALALNTLTQGFLVNLPGTPSVTARQFLGTTNQITVVNGTGLGGDVTLSIPANPIMPGTAGMGIPSGNTASRVIPASNINMRFNTDLFQIEYWDGSEWQQLAAGGSVTQLNEGTGIILTPNPIIDTGTIALNVAAMPAFTMAGAINMGGFNATNAAEPLNPQDFATKNYVDQNSLIGTAVYAATTTNLNVTQSGAGPGATLTDASGTFAALVLDGVSPPLNSPVLIKNLAAAQHEGIYILTTNGDGVSVPYQLTRATYYDSPSEINRTGIIVVQNGSTLSGTGWYNASTIVTVDTTNFNYMEYGNIVFPVTVAHGGTGNTSLTAYALLAGGTTSTGALQQITVGSAGQVLQSNGASALPTFSTATYPSTSTINQLLYSSSNNVISGLSTVNSAGLLTNSSGVPAWVASTGTGAPVLANTPTLITPILGTPTSGNLINCTNAYGLRTRTVLTSGSGTYNLPAGVVEIFVQVQGAGGGGGGISTGSSQTAAAAGGGAGGYAEKLISSPSASYSYSVGTGGNGGASTGADGSAGTASTFGTITCNSGSGGKGMTGQSTAGATTSDSGAGGSASGGDVNCGGQGGGIGIQLFNAVISGAGSKSQLGAGGKGTTNASGAGNSGALGGGGGGAQGGASVSFAGGNGGNGIIIIWEFY